MKLFKKLIITVLVAIIMVGTSFTPVISQMPIAQAATVKLTKKTLSLEVGKTHTLKVTGTTKKVTWSSSKKSVATVSSKGKVTAKAVGQASITATVSGKKYTCKVTVTEPVNPYVKDAPFKATEVKIGSLSFVAPTDWESTSELVGDNRMMATFTPADTTLASNIILDISATGEAAPVYTEVKEELTAVLTQDYIDQIFSNTFGELPFEIIDFSQNDLETSWGTVLKTEFTIQMTDMSIKQTIYDFFLNEYFVEVTSTDVNDLDLQTMTEYMIGSIILK